MEQSLASGCRKKMVCKKVKYFGHRIIHMQMQMKAAFQWQSCDFAGKEPLLPLSGFQHLSGTHASFACNHDTTAAAEAE